MNKYLVTGGAGFIGSHLAEELVKRGEAVRVLDNFSTGKKENIAHLLDKVELIEADIRDFEVCRRAARGMDFVLHQAALTSVPGSLEDPLLANEINARGTLNLLLASNEAKVKRFIFASSCAVYGDDPLLPKREGSEGKPLSPYAASKRVGELYCQVFSQIYHVSTVILRYFNIFGPRQDPLSQYAAAIPIFITKMLRGEKPTIFGDGEQSRDFIYVANVVQANILAVEAKDISGEIFNIACGKKTTINSLAEKINKLLKKKITPIYTDPRPGDIRHSFADIAKAEKMLNYKPKVSFEEGLSLTIRWLSERK
jgi:nucleoside-diphosphate-sugar epimerase